MGQAPDKCLKFLQSNLDTGQANSTRGMRETIIRRQPEHVRVNSVCDLYAGVHTKSRLSVVSCKYVTGQVVSQEN